MSTLRIDENETFETHVTVRESDKYTGQVYIKFDRNYIPEEIRGVSEMFLTPKQLDLLGRFFIREAEAVANDQAYRERDSKLTAIDSIENSQRHSFFGRDYSQEEMNKIMSRDTGA